MQTKMSNIGRKVEHGKYMNFITKYLEQKNAV